MYKISMNVLKSFVWSFVLWTSANAVALVNHKNYKNTSAMKVHLIMGLWDFQNSDYTVTGPCPKGKENFGTLEIKQEGEVVVLTLKTGKICRPSSLCTYKGAIKDGHFIVSNSAIVDNEGGKAINSLDIIMHDVDHMTAKSKSQYIHPSGIQCTWLGTMKISR